MGACRIAVFCSHIYGKHVLDSCLQNTNLVDVRVVATDNPDASFTNALGRLPSTYKNAIQSLWLNISATIPDLLDGTLAIIFADHC